MLLAFAMLNTAVVQISERSSSRCMPGLPMILITPSSTLGVAVSCREAAGETALYKAARFVTNFHVT